MNVFRIVGSILTSLSILALSELFGSEHDLARTMLSLSLFVYVWIILESVSVTGDRTFSLCASLFFSVIFIIPGIFHCAAGEFPFFSMSYEDKFVTLGSSIVLLFSVAAGLMYAVSPKQILPMNAKLAPNVSVVRSMYVIGAMLLISTAIYAARPEAFTSTRLELLFMERESPIEAVMTSAARSFAFLSFLVNLLVALRTRNWGFACLLPITLGAAFIFNNPINVPRFGLLSLIICLGFVFLNTSSRIVKVGFASAYVLGLMTVFPLLAFYARGARGQSLETGFSSYYIQSGDFDGFQSMINIAMYVHHEGLRWGNQILSALFIFVPRSVWPNKSEGTGVIAAEFAGYTFTNISSPLPGEVYADFGFVGVILAGAAFGWILTLLDRTSAQKSNLGLIFSLGMAAGFCGILLRGPLVGVIGPSGLAVLLAWLVGYIVEGRPQRPSARAMRRR